MKILEIKIQAFGGLKDFNWQLNSGANFLFGLNESGKSTVLAFIRAMFYGLGRRSQDLEKNARERYTPWQNESVMGGSLRFELAGESFLLERSFGQVKSQDKLRLFDESKFQEISLKNPESPGEELFGLGEEEFRLLVLMRRPKAELNGNLDLWRLEESGSETTSYSELKESLDQEGRRLYRGREGGEEGALKSKINELQERLESALSQNAELNLSLERQREARQRLQDLENIRLWQQKQEELSALKNQEAVFQELADHNAQDGDYQQLRALAETYGMRPVPIRELNSLVQASNKLKSAHQEELHRAKDLEHLEAETRELSLKLSRCRSAAAEEARHLEKQVEIAANIPRSCPSPKFKSGIVLVAGLGLSLVASFVTSFIAKTLFPWLGLGILLVTGLSFLLMRSEENKAAQEFDRQRASIKRIEASVQDLKNRLAQREWQIRQMSVNYESAERRLSRLATELATYKQKTRHAENALRLLLRKFFAKLPPDMDLLCASNILRDYSLAKQDRQWIWQKARLNPQDFEQDKVEERLEELQAASSKVAEELKQLMGKLQENNTNPAYLEALSAEELSKKALSLRELIATEQTEAKHLMQSTEDPARLDKQLATLEKQSKELAEDILANKLALELLERANTEYKLKAQPALHQLAESYLQKLSQGRYQKMQISLNGEISLLSQNDQMYHEDAYFSTGTRDLLHLAFRLAIAELSFKKQGFHLPLILDDSLINLDSERAEAALDFLVAYSSEYQRQVLIFSSSQQLRDLYEKQVGKSYSLS